MLVDRRYACLGLCALITLATPAAAQPRESRAAAGEKAVLKWADAEQAGGRADHAARGLLRAAKRAPSSALLTRYAQIALPCEPAVDERAQAKQRRAADNLLRTIDTASTQEPFLTLTGELGVYASWALAITGDFARSREVANSYGSRDDALTVRCLRNGAALALVRANPGEAQALLSLARGFAPTDAALATELGLLLLHEGDAKRALVVLADRFAIEPASLAARRDFAYALLAAGRALEGYQLLAVEGEVCSTSDDCLLELARAALEARKPREAEQHARTLLARREGSVPALFLIAEAQGQRSDSAGARATYSRVLELSPGNLRAKAALAGLSESRP